MTKRTAFLSILAIACALVLALAARPARSEPGEEPAIRGTTTPSPIQRGSGADESPEETAPTPSPPQGPWASYSERGEHDTGWTLVDIDTFFIRLPVGEACAVRFDRSDCALSMILPVDPLVPDARLAIDYAPDWMADDLQDLFARLDPVDQQTYAGIILAAADPYVDEIAFVVAHTAPEVLQSSGFPTELLTENAEDVYAHDPYLDYVEIVDYGDALGGGDYYSTVRYWTAAPPETIPVELPRERYYWDIVHPKITDEAPAYINPATGGAAAPPTGRFWREFLFTHADSGYPVLQEELAGCLTLWEGNVDSKVNGAVGILTQWVQDVLDFGSGAERPIQPVRIYRLHLGRCGEHADFTAAAARAALIATNSPLAPDEDHTWNEFYDRRWVPWEPVNNYVDSGWHYEGWGKSFIGVFDWRGDDWTWTVTERYTPACTVTVAVTDSAGYPVDGALVSVARKIQNYVFGLSTWGHTDSRGQVDFILGDSSDIYARVESDLGTWPPGPLYKRIVEASVADTRYSVTRLLPQYRPRLPFLPASLPPDPDDDLQIRIRWDAIGEYVYGQNRYDSNTFSDRRSEGAADFFICDASAYADYAVSDTFDAYEVYEEADSADVAFTLPSFSDWYAVISNETHMVNTLLVRGTAELYCRTSTGIAGTREEAPVRTTLLGNHPNPFNPRTTISFALASPGRVELSVLDASGRRVASLFGGELAAGEHHVRWDGRNDRGEEVGTGVYFCRLEAGGISAGSKMLLLR